jgi:hypothetical protein
MKSSSQKSYNRLMRWAKDENLFSKSSTENVTHLSMDGAYGGKLMITNELLPRFYEEYAISYNKHQRLHESIIKERQRYKLRMEQDLKTKSDAEEKHKEYEYKLSHDLKFNAHDDDYSKEPPLSITETVHACDYFRATFDLDLETYLEPGSSTLPDSEEEIKEYIQVIRSVIYDIFYKKPESLESIPDTDFYKDVSVISAKKMSSTKPRECLLECLVSMAPDKIKYDSVIFSESGEEKRVTVHKKSVHIRFRYIICTLKTLKLITNMCLAKLLERFGSRESKNRNPWSSALDDHILTVGIRMLFSDKLEQCKDCKLSSTSSSSGSSSSIIANLKVTNFLQQQQEVAGVTISKGNIIRPVSVSSEKYERLAKSYRIVSTTRESTCGHFDCVLQKRATHRPHIPKWYVKGLLEDGKTLFDEDAAYKYTKINENSIKTLMSRFSYRAPSGMAVTTIMNESLLFFYENTTIPKNTVRASDLKGLFSNRAPKVEHTSMHFTKEQSDCVMQIIREKLPPLALFAKYPSLSVNPWKDVRPYKFTSLKTGDVPMICVNVTGFGSKWCSNRLSSHSNANIYFLISVQHGQVVISQKCMSVSAKLGSDALSGTCKTCNQQKFPWWTVSGESYLKILFPSLAPISPVSTTPSQLISSPVSDLMRAAGFDEKSITSSSTSSSSFRKKRLREFEYEEETTS